MFGHSIVFERQRYRLPVAQAAGSAVSKRIGRSSADADRWTIVASPLAAAKLNGIEPHAYLKDLLERMARNYQTNFIDALELEGLKRRNVTDKQEMDAYDHVALGQS